MDSLVLTRKNCLRIMAIAKGRFWTPAAMTSQLEVVIHGVTEAAVLAALSWAVDQGFALREVDPFRSDGRDLAYHFKITAEGLQEVAR